MLAFAPLSLAYRPTALRWKQNRVFAIGAAALAGTVAWMVLCPSVLAPRYVLATLLLLAIPAAAAAEIMSRQRTLLSLLVAPAALIVLALGPRHANVDALLYRGFTSGIYRFLGPQEACSGSYPFTSDCVAARAINTEAVPGDRVLLLTYVRLWLRPELIQSASTFADSKRFAACQTATCTPSQFWAFYLAQPNFRFILHDRSSHLLPPETLVSPPKGVTVRLLSSDGGVEAYLRHDRAEVAAQRPNAVRPAQVLGRETSSSLRGVPSGFVESHAMAASGLTAGIPSAAPGNQSCSKVILEFQKPAGRPLGVSPRLLRLELYTSTAVVHSNRLMARLRILCCSTAFLPAESHGGLPYSTFNLCRALGLAGAEVRVVTTDRNGSARLEVPTDRWTAYEEIPVWYARTRPGPFLYASERRPGRSAKRCREADCVLNSGTLWVHSGLMSWRYAKTV